MFYQKFNAEVYELCEELYDAAAYYENNGDVDKAKELLAKCVAIDNNPHLRRSIATKPVKHSGGDAGINTAKDCRSI